MYRNSRTGFTLVELLVVMSIMAILAAIILANMSSAAKRGRDAERQADLRNLQTAIEAYKHRNGKYPEMGCTPDSASGDGLGWSHEGVCATYIKDLAPNFIAALPHDSARGTKQGYAYVTNTERTVYKVMAMNTVEVDNIYYNHPFKSCDVRGGTDGRSIPNTSDGHVSRDIDMYGWCSGVNVDAYLSIIPRQCFRRSENDTNQNGDLATGRFDKSYGLWGGYADSGKALGDAVVKTTAIICK